MIAVDNDNYYKIYVLDRDPIKIAREPKENTVQNGSASILARNYVRFSLKEAISLSRERFSLSKSLYLVKIVFHLFAFEWKSYRLNEAIS